MKNKFLILSLMMLLAVLVFPDSSLAAEVGASSGDSSVFNLEIGEGGNLSSSVEIFVIITMLSFLPALVIMLTCYTQIIIVLSLTRQAIGVATAPPNQVLSGIALIITLFVMAPVVNTVYDEAYVPYKENNLTFTEAIEKAEVPIKKYMVDNAKEEHIKMVSKLADVKITTPEEVPFLVATLANLISQLHDALGMGVLIMSVFIVIDMIVAAILMLLGMMMLPPNLISLPIKIITFLAAGGFSLIIEVLVSSINT